LSGGARPKAFWIGAAVVLAASVTGFFTGTRPASPPHWPSPAPAISSDRAPSYQELRSMRRGPNARLYQDALERVTAPVPGLFEEVKQSKEDKDRVVEARASRRAYDGAPPTVPHATMQMGVTDCLACHEKGARIGDRVAPRPSHDRHEACSQCHVPDADPRPEATPTEPPANSFVGLASPRQGERAWPGAPPTIPHGTLMRTHCETCHGVTGKLGVRSTHPWRQNCTQCHGPSAVLDQQPSASDREGT